jgi:hypothetical protein
MSANDKVFHALLKLLDRNDESSEGVWGLIQALSTNLELFKNVLQVD